VQRAQAITMKKPITPVITAPAITSTRSSARALGRSRLSTAYDWMNASPQGASVVPTVAGATTSA
jgi:hypothetical protein